MFYHIKKPQLQLHQSKITILLLSLCLVVLCMVLCFGNVSNIGKMNLLKSCISYVSNHIFCNNSSTMEYCRQTTYQAFGSNEAVITWQPSIYTYLQYHTDTLSTVATNDSPGSVTAPPISTTDVPSQTPDSQLVNSDLNPMEDISNGQDSYDDLFFEDLEDEDAHEVFSETNLSASAKETLANNRKIISTLTSTLDLDYMIKKLYHVNSSTGIDKAVFNVKKLLSTDVTIDKNSKEPQILIFHSHAHETFTDSRDGVKSDTVVGVGDELTRILTEDYGYNVVHYSRQYQYNYAYNQALPDLEALIKKYPSIKVILDIHRDGVAETTKTHTTVTIDKTTMAKIMFFNGVCRTTKGPIKGYQNPNLQMNLAFSLQMRLFAMETFPQLTKYNFLKSWRYNMHMMERYSLVEVGDNNNTVAEAKAAMKPLAAIIDHVLTTENSYTQ